MCRRNSNNNSPHQQPLNNSQTPTARHQHIAGRKKYTRNFCIHEEVGADVGADTEYVCRRHHHNGQTLTTRQQNKTQQHLHQIAGRKKYTRNFFCAHGVYVGLRSWRVLPLNTTTAPHQRPDIIRLRVEKSIPAIFVCSWGEHRDAEQIRKMHAVEITPTVHSNSLSTNSSQQRGCIQRELGPN